MRSAVQKSMIVTLLSVLASLGVAALVMPALGARMGLVTVVLCIACPMLIAFPASLQLHRQKERLTEARDMLSAALTELASAHAKLAEKARRDDLTGFLNRETLLGELSGIAQAGGNGVLLMIDADEFKVINDTHGHMVGDEALKAMAAAIGRTLRSRDLLGRMGGEEFAAILPAATLSEAEAAAERIRRAVAGIDLRLEDGQDIRLSVSIGLARFTDGTTPQQVLREADKRLYEAKRNGRNRVVSDEADREAA